MKELKNYIIDIKDFPEKGILFRDITNLLLDRDGLKLSIDEIINAIGEADFNIVVGPESRGFIFGMPVAYSMNKSFVPVRKKGKLPREIISEDYELEYGIATLEMHKDAIKKGDKVVIIDDLIATGGTCVAICNMIERLGGSVEKIICLIELTNLSGREKLKDYNLISLIKYSE